MAKMLVVVESPAKAKTINKYLGRDYKVVASMGHIRDLPKSKLGVEVDNDFAEEYESIPARKKVIKDLKDAAKDATEIYVATDPDREGEAIGWHVARELAGKKRKIHRLMFNEITKKAVQEAFKHPRVIDEKMVDAQRARRVLDRLVGYKISPILWDKVRRGLSAGRVQSVALRLVSDREAEIEKFVPEEYWHVFARLAGSQPPEFDAKLLKKSGEAIKVSNQEQSQAVVAALEHADWRVASVQVKERKRHPAPPFITSKLQQTARYPVKKTMMLAQQLYEGIELPGLGVDGAVGLITYMRTDSVRVAGEALTAVRDHISKTFGGEYLPEQPNAYKSKADAQDAHEAIRPTSMQYDPETVKPYLTPDQYSLYRLIWNRFLASQMTPATFDETTVDVSATPRGGGDDFLFRVKGTVPKFAGWMAAYGMTPGESSDKDAADDDEAASGVLPALAEGDRLDSESPEARAEVHAAAAAVHGSDARQGARGERHRAAEHLCLHHRRAPGSQLRQQARGQVQADRARPNHHRPADQELPRHPRRRVHAQSRRGSGQDRAGFDEPRQDAVGVLQEVQEGSDPRRQGDAEPQGGDQDRRDSATAAGRRW